MKVVMKTWRRTMMSRMIQKKDIKYLISLKNKKFRILNNEFVIEGSKLILDALQNNQLIK